MRPTRSSATFSAAWASSLRSGSSAYQRPGSGGMGQEATAHPRSQRVRLAGASTVTSSIAPRSPSSSPASSARASAGGLASASPATVTGHRGATAASRSASSSGRRPRRKSVTTSTPQRSRTWTRSVGAVSEGGARTELCAGASPGRSQRASAQPPSATEVTSTKAAPPASAPSIAARSASHPGSVSAGATETPRASRTRSSASLRTSMAEGERRARPRASKMAGITRPSLCQRLRAEQGGAEGA